MHRRSCLRRVVAALALVATAGAVAQGAPGAPQPPLQIVVPDATGSPADIVARILAPALGVAAGRLVAVTNRPGGHEAIGTEAVAKAGPEGTTALLATGALAMNAALQPALPFDAGRSLTPVALVATAPYVLATATTMPLTTTSRAWMVATTTPLTARNDQGATVHDRGRSRLEALTELASVSWERTQREL